MIGYLPITKTEILGADLTHFRFSKIAKTAISSFRKNP